jgi:Protein of unknown function (DUF1566)
MKHKNFSLSIIASVVLLTACGGNGSGDTGADRTATPSPTAAPSSSGTPIPAPTSTPTPTPTPTPTACTAALIGNTGYSLVFKGCDAANVATYYDKTECVRDNVSGLIWQGQMPAGSGHLRANDQYKTNYDNTTVAQKTDVSLNGLTIIHAPSIENIDSLNNSIGFSDYVNFSNLCGINSWRMPTSSELQTLRKVSETPKIDNVWFPNTALTFYWTSTPLQDATDANAVNFGNVSLAIYKRDRTYSVRLVH